MNNIRLGNSNHIPRRQWALCFQSTPRSYNRLRLPRRRRPLLATLMMSLSGLRVPRAAKLLLRLISGDRPMAWERPMDVSFESSEDFRQTGLLGDRPTNFVQGYRGSGHVPWSSGSITRQWRRSGCRVGTMNQVRLRGNRLLIGNFFYLARVCGVRPVPCPVGHSVSQCSCCCGEVARRRRRGRGETRLVHLKTFITYVLLLNVNELCGSYTLGWTGAAAAVVNA